MSRCRLQRNTQEQQCRDMRREWFQMRKLVAEEAQEALPTGGYFPDIYQGFCSHVGKYITGPPQTVVT